MCYISGFGYAGVKTGRGHYMERLPDVLQHGLVPIRESPECMVYRTHFRSLYHLCIGGVGIIARDGDSGGPLTCILQTKGKPKHHQVLYGLSSFSSARVRFMWSILSIICLQILTTAPSVYTKVSYYVDWINDIVSRVEKEEKKRLFAAGAMSVDSEG